MRVRFDVDEQNFTLRLELEGAPLSGEFHDFAAALCSRLGFARGINVLIDARALVAYPSAAEIAELAGMYRDLWVTGAVGLTAIVVQRDGHAAARAFQIHSGDGDPRLAVFRNPDEAMRWLEPIHEHAMAMTVSAVG